MTIQIESIDEDGFLVVDHIENTQFTLYTDQPVDPRPGDEDDHYFPVDASVRIDADEIVVPRVANIIVHDVDGRVVAEGLDVTLPPDTYHVEVSSAPAKTYFRVDGGVDVTTAESTRIRFPEREYLAGGFRSFNDQPAGTITTPGEPTAVMRAVSRFGSALKTTSPERSFPTLRGHPPLVEIGEEFSVPDHVERPETGIRIVVPPEFRALYPVVPLAYYLGATVVPGDEPRLVGDGWELSLGPSVERTAGRVLRQTFHLDCIARTEGFFAVDLHERETTSLDLDWRELYETPIAERIGEYLAIPFDRIEPELPPWTLTTDVRPAASNAETLPFVAAELSLVRSPETVPSIDESSANAGNDAGADDDVRIVRSDDDVGLVRSDDDVGLVRSDDDTGLIRPDGGSVRGIEPRSHGAFIPDNVSFVRPDPVDTVEHAWVGEGIPIGANKATLQAYRRRLAVGAVDEQFRISVLVVCNDDLMREEGNVANLYGLRDVVQFDIDVRYDLSRAEMREALESDIDFLHYVGHVDDRGMQCADGYLDLTAERLDVGVSAFLLNACQSYEQGEALIDRGSRGGIVTLADVANTPATRLGRIAARLLNSGFNLRTALHVARRDLITGQQYIVIGDGGTTVCQSRSGVAIVGNLDRSGDDRWELSAELFPNGPYGVGTMATLNAEPVHAHYYIPSKKVTASMSPEEFREFCSLEMLPFFDDGELRWSDDFTVSSSD